MAYQPGGRFTFQEATVPQRKMKNIDLDEASGVDHPAHLVEGWLLMKSTDGVDDVVDEVTTDGGDDMPDTTTEKAIDRDALSDEVRAYVEQVEKERDEAVQAAASADSDTDDDGTDDPVEKALSDLPEPVAKALAERLTKAESEASEARKAAENERRVREEAEEVSKAAGYRSIGLDPSEVGPKMRALKQADPDLYEQVTKALDAATEQANEASKILKREIGGSAGVDVDDPLSAVDKAARKMVEESGGDLTYEQAFTKALDSSEARKAYAEAEQSKQSG